MLRGQTIPPLGRLISVTRHTHGQTGEQDGSVIIRADIGAGSAAMRLRGSDLYELVSRLESLASGESVAHADSEAKKAKTAGAPKLFYVGIVCGPSRRGSEFFFETARRDLADFIAAWARGESFIGHRVIFRSTKEASETGLPDEERIPCAILPAALLYVQDGHKPKRAAPVAASPSPPPVDLAPRGDG